MPFTVRSRLVLVVVALFLVGPLVVDEARARYEDLTAEQVEALKKAWRVTNARQVGTAWTEPGFPVHDWDTATSGAFAEGLELAKGKVYGWPNPDAEWIWSRGGNTAYFRREFGLPRNLVKDEDGGVEERIVVRITANNSYSFYVNGVLVHSDSSDDEEDWMTYDQFDVTEYLDVGDNVFAVEAVNTHDPENYGLLFDAELVRVGAGGIIAPPPVRRAGC